MSEFTKGPWAIDKNEDGRIKDYDPSFACISSTVTGEWRDLARVAIRMEYCEEFEEDGLANAHLVAAAPDMYDALSIICDYLEMDGRGNAMLMIGKAALANARGE